MQYSIKSNQTETAHVAEPKTEQKPARYEVMVFITDPKTGKPLVSKIHPCLSKQDAQNLRANVLDLAEQMAQYLPGLMVIAYENSDEPEEVISITRTGLAALEAALPDTRRNAGFWSRATEPG